MGAFEDFIGQAILEEDRPAPEEKTDPAVEAPPQIPTGDTINLPPIPVVMPAAPAATAHPPLPLPPPPPPVEAPLLGHHVEMPMLGEAQPHMMGDGEPTMLV